MFKVMALAVTLLGLTLGSANADGYDWQWKAIGPARVIDGDTLELIAPRFYVCPEPDPCPEAFSRPDSVTVRLHGIDAPEMDQPCLDERDAPWPCGEAAYHHLVRMIGDEGVTCFGGGPDLGRDRSGRDIAVCHVWPTVNLNAQMVWDGYALAYRRYSRDYVYAEEGARNTRAGMWAGAFMTPWEWRAAKSAPTVEELRERLRRGLEEQRRNTL